jgi:UDP-N-acetylglucosamine 2-epimerase (non-hydrolysing)
MPEEVNRILTDRIADYLFVTEESGMANLRQEGEPEDEIFFVGNLMIDSLVHFREKASQTTIMTELGVDDGEYVLMTMHRPSNVDHPEGIEQLLQLIEGLAAERRVIFPMHPRTRNRIDEFGRAQRLDAIDQLVLLEPLGYLEFLRLMEGAAVVVTDSGGIQEETTFLGVPCLTLRENTERPVTVEEGTNELMPLDPERVLGRANEVTVQDWSPQRPPKWDGQAARRIRDIVRTAL